MLFYVAGGNNLPYKLFGFQVEIGWETQQVGGGWDRRFGLEKGIKRREGVTRLIKLFYQSNSRIYKLKIYF